MRVPGSSHSFSPSWPAPRTPPTLDSGQAFLEPHVPSYRLFCIRFSEYALTIPSLGLGFIQQTAPRGGHGQAHSTDEESEAL